MAPAPAPRGRRPRPAARVALAIFALLAGIYLLSASGHFYAVDEQQMFAVTESLALRQSFAIEAAAPGQPPLYSSYGPGQSIAAVPLYLLGAGVARLFPAAAYAWIVRAFASWLNVFATAGTAALLFLAAARLGYRTRAAVGTALLYALATMAWTHGKTFFAEPATALLLFGSFAVALPDRDAGPGSPRPLAPLYWSGLLAGLAPAFKIQAGLALPLLGLWALGFGIPLAGERGFAGWLRALLRRGLAWGLGAATPLAVLGLYQWALYGSPLRSGYGSDVGGVFTHDLWDGVTSLLWSSGKGLLWYAPPLLLLPAGLWLLRRRDWRAALLCLLMLVAHLLFYGRVIFWHGDGAWGPRYLNIMLPFAVFPLVALLDTVRGRRTPWRSAALALALLLAVPVQIAGVAIDFDTYINAERDADARYHDPARSPIVGQLGYAWQQARLGYDIYLATGRVALLRGFSYSEGDRERGQQTPRWTLPEAEIAVRPDVARPVLLSLALSGCRPAPAPTAHVTIRSGGALLLTADPCPARRYQLALPARGGTIEIAADPWNPRADGSDRGGPLGVFLVDLSARAGDHPLVVSGALVPIPPLPSDPHDLYYWTSDHRYGHWDFWWWYLAHSGLPTGPSIALAIGWLACALGLIALGLRSADTK